MSVTHPEWFTEAFEDSTAFSVRCAERLFDQKSDFQRVEILSTEALGRVLVLDGCFMVTEKDTFIYHEMLVHPAMQAVSDPKRVLIIGGGDGGAVTEAVKYPGVESVTLCEIDPLVVEACRQFFPTLASGLEDPRVKVVHEDGAAYVRQFEDYFDVVLVDSTDPVGPGVALFETSFYDSVRRSLRKGGALVCQSESPLFMKDNFLLAVRNLTSAFGPQAVRTYLATIPSYPGALWSFTFCSEGVEPLGGERAVLPPFLQGRLQYYTPEVHRAAFALPVFVRDLIRSVHSA
jgi:spermidine synthase